MNEKASVLVYKYARAFFNCFSDQISFEAIDSLSSVLRYFKKNGRILQWLEFPDPTKYIQQQFLNHIFSDLKLPLIFKKLFFLLKKHQRLSLLPHVFSVIIDEYRKRNELVLAHVESSIELDDEYKQYIKKFLERKLNKTVPCSFAVNTALIAGIRIQGKEFLWEYSVNDQLRRIKTIQAEGLVWR